MRKLWTTFNERVVDAQRLLCCSLQRFFGAILCQDIVNSEFNRQLFSAYDFHHGTSAHCTLKNFESRAALNNPLCALKTCELDPAPTFLVQELIDDLLYFLTVLSNSLLLEEYLPVSQKPSIILPDLKHDGLDQCDPANYRPHCKCHILSTCLQHIVANQLIAYLDANEPSHQLGFHRNDSTETLLLRLLSDFYSTLAMARLPFLLCWM